MFQSDLLRDKRILITGGGTSLGRAMAQRFMGLGASVYVCGRRKDVLRQTESELAHLTGGTIFSISCDVRDRESVEQMIENIWRQGALDVLVNNAAGNFLARTEELSPRAFEAVIGIVLTGTLNVTWPAGGDG